MEGAVLVLHQVAILALPAAETEAAIAAAPRRGGGGGVCERCELHIHIQGRGCSEEQDHRDEQQLTRSYGSLSGSLRRQIPICMLAEWQ
uniref:Secreted protein n=1 Tax=Oryza glaberrima TaxID=4538 RepID=I1QYV4_ORYGL